MPDYSHLLKDPAFMRWFAKSKARDRHGLPMRLYHGTGDDIDVFQGSNANIPGFFSSEPKLASEFATDSARAIRENGYDDGAANVMPVFLSIQNPFDARRASHRKLFGLPKYADDEMLEDHDLVKRIKARGFDSIYTREPGETNPWSRANVGIFNPRQAKSIFNRGTWDPSDPRIQFAGGGLAMYRACCA